MTQTQSRRGESDLAWLRFLRARVDEAAVLNGGPVPDGEPAADLPEQLAERALAWRAGHEPAAAYRERSQALRTFDPALLATREQRLAGWINLYNALIIDAVRTLGITESIRQVPGFFRQAAYQIGGQRYSAELIEHGLLRANRPPHPRLPTLLGGDDPRRAYALPTLDPRVHCALNCATRSCPPPQVYTAAAVDAQLDRACQAFIQGGGLDVDSDGALTLSGVFAFYLDDFGGPQGLIAFVEPYLPDPETRQAAQAAWTAGRVAFQPYDWALDFSPEF